MLEFKEPIDFPIPASAVGTPGNTRIGRPLQHKNNEVYNEVNINHKYHNILTILWFGLRHIEGLRWTNIYKLILNSIEIDDKQVSHQYGSVTPTAGNSDATAVNRSKDISSANSDCALAKQTITNMRVRQDSPDKACIHYITEIIPKCFRGFEISPTKEQTQNHLSCLAF